MPGKLFTAGWVLLLGMLSSSYAADTLENATIYEITIPADNHRVAIVTASLTPADRGFHMFPGANQLPKRWATFVSDFQVHDENDPVSAADFAVVFEPADGDGRQALEWVGFEPGTYLENVNFLGKAILLTSVAGRDVTTIDGSLQTRGPWHESVPAKWQRTSGSTH